ncbi:O-antigen ligase family protein [Sphingomonas pruni]|uniref:O-antigen ligase family protein n=1 Tax=Sphingomonas pruni TaxID=40683 RepID=UPI00083558CC|nr:O-antigen ligase family protein [Sphingomonas pruni]
MPSPFNTNRPQTLYAGLVLLTVAVLFGGASRYEVGTTILPRLTALAAIVYLFWPRHRSAIWVERGELIFWAVLFALPLVQLIPLPWSVWTALPGRGLAKQVFTALGDKPWLPISLSPSRTLDFLLALFVPFAAWLLGSHLDYPGRTIILRAMLAWALVSAVLGLVQLALGAGSQVYFYAITNDDSSVGFFANANHLGLFLAGGIVIALAWLADSMTATGRIIAPAAIACVLAICVMLFGIAGTSSRAAAIFSVIALLAGLAMLPLERVGLKRRHVLGGAAIATLTLVSGLGLVLSGRLLSNRFQIEDGTQDRIEFIPQLVHAASDFFPFGSGLGTFEPIFKSYEPPNTLSFGYWNQAHQDYLQTAIEGGLVGILLILAFLTWFAVRVILIWYMGNKSSRVRRQQATSALFIALISAHGLGDYPLRTGTISCLFGFLAAFITAPRNGKSSSRPRLGGDLGEVDFGVYQQNDMVPIKEVGRGIAAQGGDHYS